jgi:hypothetical protein
MKRIDLNVPTVGFVVATRAALGVGIGLLIAGRLPEQRRKRVGMSLVALGAATTIPAVFALRRGLRNAESTATPPSTRSARTAVPSAARRG